MASAWRRHAAPGPFNMMHASIMLLCIMFFLNRTDELDALEGLFRAAAGGLAVLSGRRRVGKTRLLVEWIRRRGGIYFVADESTPALQRRYLAEALGHRLPGFGEVEYPDWRSLFSRLAQESERARFRGPIVIDELPYLVASSPELPSVLQAWLDHAAKAARLVVALAGSSQRMMQGLVLDANAALYGRARVVLEVKPLAPRWLPRAFPRLRSAERLLAWTAWGGVPRYWELATELRGSMASRIDALVLDPIGPLHLEPDRLLLEESPPAADLRPLLDAIGGGAHRVSEIAARIGRPATSLSRPLDRLLGLGLVHREVPFGESERDTKRSLYRMADPFLRLWFRVVATNRGYLAVSAPRERRALLAKHLPGLAATAFEELCRGAIPHLGEWTPAGRWWQGSAPEWDVVSRSPNGRELLLGEAKAGQRSMTQSALRAEVHRLAARPPPALPGPAPERIHRWLFVPAVEGGAPLTLDGVRIVTLDDVLR